MARVASSTAGPSPESGDLLLWRAMGSGAFRALWAAMVVAGCASAPPYPKSEHFNGERFHNLEPAPRQSFLEITRHVLFDRSEEWPVHTLRAEVARLPDEVREGEIAITFVNHSTVLIQLPGLNILTDPVWSERIGPVPGLGPRRAVEPGIAFEELPSIDVVLVSHNHYDHMDVPTLRRLEREHHPRFLVPLGDEDYLKRRSLGAVAELDWWESVVISGAEFVFAPAVHNSARGLWTEGDSLWGSFVIRRKQANIYFAGDTAYGDHFYRIRERFGDFDVALLPIGAYLPRDMTAPFHMTPADAVKAHQDLRADTSIAIHYGAFRMTSESYHQPVTDLMKALLEVPQLSGSFEALPEGRTTLVWLR